MDLKMENIYVTYTDNMSLCYKIGDLGLVRAIEVGREDTEDDDDCRNDGVCAGERGITRA